MLHLIYHPPQFESSLLVYYINLTPFIPLSFKGEGELVLKEGLAPLLDTPD